MKYTVGFPRRGEFEKAVARLSALGLSYEVLSPEPGFGRVAVPAVVCEIEALAALHDTSQGTIVSAGWVEFQPSDTPVPTAAPTTFPEDIFGESAIMFLGQCMADPTRLRLIAHLSGDLLAVLPYLNAEIARAAYNPKGNLLTLMEGQRLITLYGRRIAISKANDLVDGWRALEWLRKLVNDTWRRREHIVPSHEVRHKPPVLEVYRRLPGTNCGLCGERTCSAFAARLWRGEGNPNQCTPLSEPTHTERRAALWEVCAGLGFSPDEGTTPNV